jgi:hypothetical protein
LCHRILGDARLYALLRKYDEDLAASARENGCECGGVLHVANYPRKPRGGPAAGDACPEDDLRFSFCCDREGCRVRVTPPSLRFLGRRVFFGAVVVLVSAMMNGPTRRRVAELSSLVGASERTLRRWRTWWRTAFTESALWRAEAGCFARPVAPGALPHSLLERFAGDEGERLVAALRFLSPITTTIVGFAMAS